MRQERLPRLTANHLPQAVLASQRMYGGGVGGVGEGMMMPGQHQPPQHALSSSRSRSGRRAGGEMPVALGPGGSPSKHSYHHSLSQPASARGSPLGIGASRGILSPISGRHRSSHQSTVLGRHPYGASRSSNNSPLTLPMEHLPQSLSTSSAYGHGFPAYYDDPGSPGAMDGVGLQSAAGRPMHRMGRRPPLRSYHSIEREPGYRDRSFDRMDSLNARSGGGGHRGPRDRSLDRALYSTRDDAMHSSAYGLRDRDGALLDDPALGSAYGRDPLGHTARNAALHGMGPPPPGGGAFGVDPRAPYGAAVPSSGTMSGRMGAVNDNFVMELQARLNDLQNQFGSVKRELDATTQKLGSSMHSIKTFWSPELKKERALRKEEAAKYALINDQLKILRSENQVL